MMTKCHMCHQVIPDGPYRNIIPTVNDRTNRISDKQYCSACLGWYKLLARTTIDQSRIEKNPKFFQGVKA